MEPETQEFEDLPDQILETDPLAKSEWDIGEENQETEPLKDKSSQPEPFDQPSPLAKPGDTTPSASMPPPPAPDRMEYKMKVKARLEELRWGIGTKIVYHLSTCWGNFLKNKTW